MAVSAEDQRESARLDDGTASQETSCITADASETLNTSLLMRVQSADDEAWQRLVHLYSPLVYRLCRRSQLQQDDAQDIAQEVFRAIHRRVVDFKKQGKRHSFRGWLWTITRNKIRDLARARAGREKAVGGTQIQWRLGAVPDVNDELVNDESHWVPTQDDKHQLLHGVLDVIRAEFADNTFQAFWRSAVKGHTSAEIAEDLDMTKSAVRQAKYRILRRLRQEMGDLI